MLGRLLVNLFYKMIKFRISIIVFALFAGIGSWAFLFLSKEAHVYADNTPNSVLYLPVINKPHCTSHDVQLNVSAPSTVAAGSFFTTTAILTNLGCSEIFNPSFSIVTSDNFPSQPHNAPPVPITLSEGDEVTFTFTILVLDNSTPSFRVNSSARFFATYSDGEIVQGQVFSPFEIVKIDE